MNALGPSEEEINVENEIKKLLYGHDFRKDTSPHYINPEDTLPAFLKPEEVEIDVMPDPKDWEPMPDFMIVKENAIREDIFLNSVIAEYNSLQDRLRHRATMMRIRADEFDARADIIHTKISTMCRFVESVVEHIKDTGVLLEQHAHIEPEVVKP